MPVPKIPITLTNDRRFLHDQAFAQIRTRIQDGTYEPGVKLDDSLIAEEIGTSRGPVRIALGRLAEYGLVESSANRYTRVSVPRLELFVPGIQVVLALWKLGIDLVVPRIDGEAIARLRLLLLALEASLANPESMDRRTVIAAFDDLILFFSHESANPFLVDALDRNLTAVSHIARNVNLPLNDERLQAFIGSFGSAVVQHDVAAGHNAIDQLLPVATVFVEQELS